MFGMFGVLLAMAQLVAAAVMLYIAVALTVEHPVPGLVAFAVFYLLLVRPIAKRVRRYWKST